MTAFVLDASTAVSWCFEEVQTPYAVAVLNLATAGVEVHVPAIWPFEVTNPLIKSLRRRLILREEMFEYAQRLTVDAEGDAFNRVLMLAERYQLTTYDAAYLELAGRKGIPLATADKNLIQAAMPLSIAILQFPQ